MANQFFTGFNGITTAQLLRRFTGDASFVAVGATGRFGQGLTVNFRGLTLPIAGSPSTLYVGFHFKSPSSVVSSTVMKLLQFSGGGSGNIHSALCYDPTNGKWTVRNAADVAVGTSIQTGQPGTHYWLGIKIVVSDTVGVLELQVDGITQFTSTGLDTKAGSTGSMDTLMIGDGNAWSWVMSNLYVNDASGSAPHNTYWPELQVDAVDLAANDSVNFTPLSGTNKSNVDDGNTPDDDSTYNESDIASDRDLFTVSGYVAPSVTILGVAVRATMKKTDVNPRTANAVLKSGSAVNQGTPAGLSAAYQELSLYAYVDPNTSAAFADAAAINALKVGYEIAT